MTIWDGRAVQAAEHSHQIPPPSERFDSLKIRMIAYLRVRIAAERLREESL